MISHQTADESQPDDDYFIRLLAFMWRYCILFAAIILSSSLISVVLHQSSLPYRTVISVRLVSPCVAYKHREYWEPSSKSWRSQLNAAASAYQTSELRIVATVGEEPWLIALTAEHKEDSRVEGLLRDLVGEAERQLGVSQFGVKDADESGLGQTNSSIGSSALMLELRQKLTKIEQALAAIDVVQQGEGFAEVNPAVHVSGTWSPVPIQSVPYFPWFERLQARVCEELSVSANAKSGDQLVTERQEMAEDLEQASILMTQVWFSLDPLNPVNELPRGNIQSVYSSPNYGESILRTAALGCWFGVVAAAAIAAVAMWSLEVVPKIIARSSTSTGIRGN